MMDTKHDFTVIIVIHYFTFQEETMCIENKKLFFTII